MIVAGGKMTREAWQELVTRGLLTTTEAMVVAMKHDHVGLKRMGGSCITRIVCLSCWCVLTTHLHTLDWWNTSLIQDSRFT